MPKLIAVSGPPGSGKTTICSIIRNHIDISWPRVDALKLMVTDRESTEERRSLAHQVFDRFVEVLMDHRKDILLEIPLTYPDIMNIWVQAQERAYVVSGFMLLPPLEICVERHNRRHQPERRYKIPDEKIRNIYAA